MDKKVLAHALAMKLRDVAYEIEHEVEHGIISTRKLAIVRDILDEIEKTAK